MKTMDRAEEMLIGEKNTFFELSSPSFFRRLKAKVPFASERVSMMVSLRGSAVCREGNSSGPQIPARPEGGASPGKRASAPPTPGSRSGARQPGARRRALEGEEQVSARHSTAL